MRELKFWPEYEHINVHIMFNTNMDGKFTIKEKLVTYVPTTSPSSLIVCSSILSMDSVTILFLLVSLNDLEIFARDIGNSYLKAKFREKL